VRQDRDVPLRPPEGDDPLDPRLHPYRDRGGLLYREDAHVGLLIVHSMRWSLSTKGHLWWRRWSRPTEAIEVLFEVDGSWGDTVVDPSALDAVVAEWAAGSWDFNGEHLRLSWLSDRESRLTEQERRLYDPGRAGGMEQVRSMWARHLQGAFPARLRGEQIEGVDLVMLDAEIAGCVSTWIARRGELDEQRRDLLDRLVVETDTVIPYLTAEERFYYRRLQRLAGIVLATTS
jgi:hypothetical protein